jgi:AcrR family transcriptional regulator
MTTSKSSPRHPPSAQKASERILETATELFYRQGIRAVGVDEIVNTAGVTKPSLYRGFSSKDELAAAYLRDYEKTFWQRFELSVDAHPGDPRAQILHFLAGVSQRAAILNYRGCGLTNAAVEYPDHDNPARIVSEANKRLLRARLRQMAADMGAEDPATLGDGLHLLLEGAYASAQLFAGDGPSGALAIVAERLIDASLLHPT